MNHPALKIETDYPEPAAPRRGVEFNIIKLADHRPNLAAVTLSEDAIALEFIERHGPNVRYDHSAKCWFIWNGNRWEQDETGTALSSIRDLSRELAKRKEERTQRSVGRAQFVRGVEELARHDQNVAVSSDIWDRDVYLLGTPFGVIDLRQGVHRVARREDYITKQVAVAASDATDCPRWLKFLDEATGGNKQLERLLQQWAGYSLTGDTREQVMVYMYGRGGNGKGVFLNTLAGIMADYARTAAMETFTASQSERHPEELARLAGARLVSASETEAGRRWAENRIKQLTGRDIITARLMRQDSFEFRPQFKLTLLGNHAPVISNLDDAIRRRFIIVPFTKKPDKPDPKLEELLQAEWPGILRWAIDGTLDWLANGLIIPDTVIEATAEYFDEQDLLAQWLDECCHIAPNDQNVAGKTAALFGSWEEFAERHGENPGTQRSFNEKMRNRGFVRKKKRLPDGNNTPAFLGIALMQRQYSSE